MTNDKSVPPGAGLGQILRRDTPDSIRELPTLTPCPACKRLGICMICNGTMQLVEERFNGTYASSPCPSCLDGNCRVCSGQGWCTGTQASNWNLKHVASVFPRPIIKP